MANQNADIAQEEAMDELRGTAEDLKAKAKVAGTAAWDMTRATYEQLQHKTRDYSQATDRAIREKPYVALGIALGIGLLLGAFATRKKIVVEKD
jgi:ElaB/YqjD/DUF883 family membrane-anchored ribosome-binding protein